MDFAENVLFGRYGTICLPRHDHECGSGHLIDLWYTLFETGDSKQSRSMEGIQGRYEVIHASLPKGDLLDPPPSLTMQVNLVYTSQSLTAMNAELCTTPVPE